jgi:putative membrane protein
MTDFWTAWNWNPIIGGLLALSGWRYMNGIWQLWQRAGHGRGVKHWQVIAFWSGLAVVFIALISPIDTFAATSLAMHMSQHLLLMLVAAPLLVLGLPPLASISMIPKPWRRPLVHWWHRRRLMNILWHTLTKLWIAWGIYALVLWGWHIPFLYELAVENDLIHLLEHTSFLGAGLLFWWSLYRTHYGLGALALFTTAIHSSLLGALMTFSPQLWYCVYDSLQDQQLAGLIMWIPGGLILLSAVVVMLWRWLYEMDMNDAKTIA